MEIEADPSAELVRKRARAAGCGGARRAGEQDSQQAQQE